MIFVNVVNSSIIHANYEEIPMTKRSNFTFTLANILKRNQAESRSSIPNFPYFQKKSSGRSWEKGQLSQLARKYESLVKEEKTCRYIRKKINFVHVYKIWQSCEIQWIFNDIQLQRKIIYYQKHGKLILIYKWYCMIIYFI